GSAEINGYKQRLNLRLDLVVDPVTVNSHGKSHVRVRGHHEGCGGEGYNRRNSGGIPRLCSRCRTGRRHGDSVDHRGTHRGGVESNPDLDRGVTYELQCICPDPLDESVRWPGGGRIADKRRALIKRRFERACCAGYRTGRIALRSITVKGAHDIRI